MAVLIGLFAAYVAVSTPEIRRFLGRDELGAAATPTQTPTLVSPTPPTATSTSRPPTETPISPTLTSTPPRPATQPPLTGLSPETVRSWCQGADCTPERFEQVTETTGAVNPNGVHMRPGHPVAINLPPGHRADVWDCFRYTISDGGYLPQVCEMTVRKMSP